MSLGTLMLYNGEITKNEIVNGNGAGVCVDGGKFYMYNGSISNNKVSYSGNGGGVYAKDNTDFVISGGSIDSNHAPSSGGGIYYESKINKSVNFTISGGNIARNTAVTGNGGGIWLNSAYGTMKFTMSGGRISNNVTSKTAVVYIFLRTITASLLCPVRHKSPTTRVMETITMSICPTTRRFTSARMDWTAPPRLA